VSREATTVEERSELDGTATEWSKPRLRALVELAILAPSSHNTQPWLFRIGDGSVEVHADRSRTTPVVDPDNRELMISCGAAVGFLRLAMRASGFEGVVEHATATGIPDLLAIVRPGGKHPVTAEDAALIEAMTLRRTNRRAFEPRSVSDATLVHLSESVRREGAWLRVVTEQGGKHSIADLVAEGDRRQADDPAFRRELAEWIRSNHSRAGDGIPGYSQGIGDLASLAGPWIIRTFDWGNGRAASDRQLAEGSPALAVLGTDDDAPEAWVRAGEALARMLLLATLHGLSASFLNQPIEIPELRRRLAHTLGLAGPPQLLLRLGYGPEVPPTPRRDLEDVLLA
jgi:hypothetical protein